MEEKGRYKWLSKNTRNNHAKILLGNDYTFIVRSRLLEITMEQKKNFDYFYRKL